MSYQPLQEPFSLPDLHEDLLHITDDPMRGFAGRIRDPPMDPKYRLKLILSYAPDWAITIGLAGVFFALDKVPGFKRQFSLEDTSLRHTFAVHERVPDFALYMIAFVAPLVIQPIINLISVQSWWDLHASTLGLILSLALTGSITQFTKITVGRPRPDVIDRCIPLSGAVDPPLGLSTVNICTQTDMAILHDGWRSFPSGHSSLSFAGLGFLSFYMAGKVHLFDRRGHARKTWLALTPLSGAALVAISRTMDYRHHWQDVTVGSLLGLLVAYFTYRQYYPSLASEVSHKPYSPPIHRNGSILPTHNHSREPSIDARLPERQGPYVDRFSHEGLADPAAVPLGSVSRDEQVSDSFKDRPLVEHHDA